MVCVQKYSWPHSYPPQSYAHPPANTTPRENGPMYAHSHSLISQSPKPHIHPTVATL